MNAQSKKVSKRKRIMEAIGIGILIVLVLVATIFVFQGWNAQEQDSRTASRNMWNDLRREVGSELPLTGPYPAMFRLEQIVELDDGNTHARGVLLVLLPEDAQRWQIIPEDISSCKFTVYYYTGGTLREIASESCPTLHRRGEVRYQLFVELPEPRVITFDVPYEITGIEIRAGSECPCPHQLAPPPPPPPPTPPSPQVNWWQVLAWFHNLLHPRSAVP